MSYANTSKAKRGRPATGRSSTSVGIGIDNEVLSIIDNYCALVKRGRSEVVNEVLNELHRSGRFDLLGLNVKK